MILYLDTSALVKLYIEELHSDDVRRWADEAEIVATCRVAYPEAVSAFNRRMRAGDMMKNIYGSAMKYFRRDWDRLAIVDFREIDAGRLAAKHGLRGFDAIHLSAALVLASVPSGPDVWFSSFDSVLNRAAAGEKISVLVPV
ncbi:MAG: type II toxin-antitoxin system VapC family toxin [Deltaproteobacteria bacterium]|nr:type II toxin-antitoxin system VapC family toxin [Deltaproteobacteria bacterium]